jgi:rhodanese-related sulfurtransferase
MFMRIIMLLMFIQLPSVEVVEKSVYEVLLKEGHQLIDLRTPGEFMEGHIDSARNINVKSIEFLDQINSLSKEDTMLIYCRSGRRSAKASHLMDSLGFKKIYDLRGGYLNWTGVL